MFLVRPPPRPLESLSSWRQRAGVANGFRRYPAPDGMRAAHDPDRLPRLDEMRWLEEEHRVSEFSVRGTTLEHFGVQIAPEFGATPKLRWVLPLGTRKQVHFGPLCCPQCLSEDEIPYFRISWRFAFLGCCPKHGCDLLDRCPNCGHALWPANIRNLSDRAWQDFSCCPLCQGRLTVGNSQPARVDEFSDNLWRCASAGVVPPELRQAENSIEVFSGLWTMCQLLIRHQSGHLWELLPFEGSVPSFLAAVDDKSSEIELLPLAERVRVLRAAHWLLQEWPLRFLDVTSRGELSRHHFTATRAHHPRWLVELLEKSLARRKRGVTTAQVHTAIEEIKASGRKLSKSEVRRTLGVTEARAIDELLSQRRSATTGELIALCRKFEQRMATIPTSRDQRVTLLRDYLILLLSVLSGMQVESVCEMQESEVESVLATSTIITATDDPIRHLIIVRARQLNDEYASTARAELARLSADGSNWFLSRTGDSLAGPSVRERVAKLMRSGFPEDLWNSADAFTDIWQAGETSLCFPRQPSHNY